MKKINKKLNNNDGYAILFTVVVVGIISMITIGLSNAAFKQMILSSVARDSTTAFYQADTASECALYADSQLTMDDLSSAWNCGGSNLKYTNGTLLSFTLSPESPSPLSKCFDIEVSKEDLSTYIKTTVTAKGYNLCNKSNIRTVERALEITY